LYRETILGFLDENPDTAQYVPEFVTKALERDLEDWKQEDLQARYVQLSVEVQQWQAALGDAASQGQAKLDEVQTNLAEARNALNETKEALDNLSEAGANLKGSVSGSAE
jgi:chromosome segregation ATPase